MIVPDLISPIVGYRAWHYHSTPDGCLTALVHPYTLWPHHRRSVALCTVAPLQWVELDDIELPRHNSPELSCTCGLYAAKDFDRLFSMTYMEDMADRVWGEVNLWGKVIEHDEGYRAEFAYPRRLIVPYRGFPFRLLEIEKRVERFAKYGVPVYFKNKSDEFLLWEPETGMHNVDLLVDMKLKSHVKPTVPDLIPGTRVWMQFPKHYVIVQRMKRPVIYLRSSTKEFQVAAEDFSWDTANSRWVVYTPHYIVRGL